MAASVRISSSVGTRSIRPVGGVALQERPQPVDELVRREAPDPLAVEPLESLAVEDGPALVDRLELEPGAQLVEPEDLLLGARSTSRAAPGS